VVWPFTPEKFKIQDLTIVFTAWQKNPRENALRFSPLSIRYHHRHKFHHFRHLMPSQNKMQRPKNRIDVTVSMHNQSIKTHIDKAIESFYYSICSLIFLICITL